MAKSTNGTKKLNEALTPDQVSKVEDKYKSIYSGMLKGNKKKLMKYIDPKLKRPNPDAMAMGRAINLVKKDSDKEEVNEGYQMFKGKMKKDLTLGGKMGSKFDMPKKSDTPKVTFKKGEKVELEIQPNSYHIYSKDGRHGYMDKQLAPQLRFNDINDYVIYESINEEIIDWPGEINYGGKRYVFFKQKDGKVTYEHEKYKGDKLTFGSKKEMDDFLGDYTAPKGGTQSSGFGESLNEDNSYDSFKTDESERFLNRSQVVELLPVLKNSLNKLNFSPSKQPTLSVKRYGLSSSNKGYVISMYIPTSKDDIIVELGKYPKDDKTDEVSISLYLPNEEGRLTQVAYETSTSPKGEELAEDSNVLSKVISMANQWYEKPNTIDERLATLVKEVYSEKQRKWACAQDGPEFDEMCKDTAISKKKLKETTMKNNRLTELIKAALTGPVKEDKTEDKKAAEILKSMVSPIKEDKVKDFQKLYNSHTPDGNPFTQNQNQLHSYNTDPEYKAWVDKIELEYLKKIKNGGDKEEIKILEEMLATFKKLRDKYAKLKKGEEEEMEKSSKKDLEAIKAATKELDDEAMMESSTLKEGVWSRGTATQIRDFLRDLNSLKDKYYSIVGSDDVFDGLNRAERAAEEMAYDAGRSIKEITELATTPIKDDIYAIGSRIYKDPYEAISLVATDQTVVVRDFARKDKKFKAAVMDYVKSKGLETSVDRDGLYIDTKPLDFKGIPLMNEKKQRPDYPDIDGDGDTKEPMAKAAKDKKSMVESIFKKLRG